jgi:hypothetical protein
MERLLNLKTISQQFSFENTNSVEWGGYSSELNRLEEAQRQLRIKVSEIVLRTTMKYDAVAEDGSVGTLVLTPCEKPKFYLRNGKCVTFPAGIWQTPDTDDGWVYEVCEEDYERMELI